MSQAKAQAALIRVKVTQEARNKVRVESSRASQPDSGIMITSAIR